MNVKASVPIRSRLLMMVTALAMMAFGATASANVVRINFSGLPGSGYADLTLEAATAGDTVDADHVPLAITGASGRFNGMAITGVRRLTNDLRPDSDTMPASYGLLSIPGYGDHDGITYDNLFYATGSPMVCPPDEYPFHGGMFDVLGVMLALDNGSFVDVWSFGVVDPTTGDLPPFVSGLTYGLKFIQPTADGGYAVLPGGPPPFPLATVTVAEPASLWLFGAMALGFFAWRRSAETRKRTTASFA